ncbi:hypothetical protein SGA01_60750 [Streptomyces gardneri]|uniref:Uncharacterized protein n=1 Tax=Streptomyces gardneri TaxID=66892 RepID=A0A4Y3RX50_9ACTN|nr:hypothetical protein SGA01_60750 [Streptomyces gardneri]
MGGGGRGVGPGGAAAERDQGEEDGSGTDTGAATVHGRAPGGRTGGYGVWPAAARDAATGLGWGVLPLGSKGGERVG